MKKIFAIAFVSLVIGFAAGYALADDYEVSGSNEEGDYVYGDVETQPGSSSGEGVLYDTEGNQYNVEETESSGSGGLAATDDEGESYDLST